MNMESKDRKINIKKSLTIKSLVDTLVNSINGIIYYAKDGKSIIIYMIGLFLEILMGILYKINGLEWIIIICMFAVLLSVELLNTAIEKACDAITTKYNLLIKNAKDCGSGATFIIFFVILILNVIIFAPKILIYLN